MAVWETFGMFAIAQVTLEGKSEAMTGNSQYVDPMTDDHQGMEKYEAVCEGD